MIHGLLSTILLGMVGALAAEVIRIVPALRQGKPPTGWELLASALMVALGAGACLFGWEDAQSAFKVAVMGAAFPLLFSAAVDAARTEGGGGDVAAFRRSVLSYLAGRF